MAGILKIPNAQSSWQMFISQFGGIVASQELIEMFDKGIERNNGSASLSEIGKIELKNVSFSFNDGDQILNNINLEISKNEAIAFVGASGSGKTTLVNIIVGLFESSKGNIFVNGVDRSLINLVELRSKVGYITQEPVIFNDSIFNNVTFWAPKNQTNLDKFWKSISLANLNQFVLNLESKEDTPLGDNGVKDSPLIIPTDCNPFS